MDEEIGVLFREQLEESTHSINSTGERTPTGSIFSI